jgi:hypothetical protein
LFSQPKVLTCESCSLHYHSPSSNKLYYSF